MGSHRHTAGELQTHFLVRFLVCPYFERGSHEGKACDFSKTIFKKWFKMVYFQNHGLKKNMIANLQKCA